MAGSDVTRQTETVTSRSTNLETGARHSRGFYERELGHVPIWDDERMFIPCDGGPCVSRLERFPPRLEIQEQGGWYVLDDDGPYESWCYRFVWEAPPL